MTKYLSCRKQKCVIPLQSAITQKRDFPQPHVPILFLIFCSFSISFTISRGKVFRGDRIKSLFCYIKSLVTKYQIWHSWALVIFFSFWIRVFFIRFSHGSFMRVFFWIIFFWFFQLFYFPLLFIFFYFCYFYFFWLAAMGLHRLGTRCRTYIYIRFKLETYNYFSNWQNNCTSWTN